MMTLGCTYLLTVLLSRFICRPPIKDIVPALAGLLDNLFLLFFFNLSLLHFVLLAYSFLIYVI